MKQILVCYFLSISFFSFSQENDTVPEIKTYEDFNLGLFVSKVVEIPSKTQKELVVQFKNWASTSFVNLKEVIVSETESQIVLNYITKTNSYFKTLGMKTPLDRSWYVRMVVQFKDGKIRAQFFDDGNTFVAGTYSQYGSVPATQARTVFIKSFNKKPETFKELHKPANIYYDLHAQWQSNIETMALNFEKGMKDFSIQQKKDDF